MKIKNAFLISILAISSILSCPESAQSELIKLINGIETKKYVLDNGLTIITKEDHSSALVAIEARIGSGSTTEEEFTGSGISHFVEHMLFKGTAIRRVGEIDKEIKSLGGSMNAFTSHDYTGYRITVPSQHFKKAMSILKDALFNSSFDARELEKERNVILKEIKLNRDEPARYLSRLLWSTAFRTHPYQHPVIGYEALFRKLTRKDLLKYYKRMYVPNNITLAVVGDLDMELAYRDIKNDFQNVERGILVDIKRASEHKQISKRELKKTEEIKLAYFGLGYRSTSIFSKDLFALDVLAAILGEGTSSRLNQTLYREKELVYSIGAWNYTPMDPGLFIISGVTEPEKVEKTLEEISHQLDVIKKDGIGEDELTKAKNSALSSYIFSRQTVSGQASDLVASELITGDYNFSKRYVEGIDSVELEDIKRVASRYLNEESVSQITILPKGAGSQTASELKKDVSSYKIQRFTLPTGMIVLLREDHRLPLVSIKAVFAGGLRTENAANNGICNLMATMLLKGTDSKSERDISNIMESMGGNIGYISGKNSFGITMDFLSRDLDTSIKLSKDILLNSNIPEDILEREKNSVLAAIKSEEDDIYQYSARLLKENLFKLHPYKFRTIGKAESIKNIKREDVVNYYNRWCRPNNMVLAVFGDIKPQDVLEKIEKEFSGFKKGILPSVNTPRENPPKTKTEISRVLKKAQSIVMIGFKGTTVFEKDKYILAVISSILSGRNGRLSMRLREKLGLAYALGSFSQPGVDPGYYIFYVGTSAASVPVVKNELLRQIEILIKKYVRDEEMNLAKKELIGQNKVSLQTNSALTFRSSLDELYGLGYDDYLNFNTHIESVTKEDVLQIARKYFNLNTYALVIVEGR